MAGRRSGSPGYQLFVGFSPLNTLVGLSVLFSHGTFMSSLSLKLKQLDGIVLLQREKRHGSRSGDIESPVVLIEGFLAKDSHKCVPESVLRPNVVRFVDVESRGCVTVVRLAVFVVGKECSNLSPGLYVRPIPRH